MPEWMPELTASCAACCTLQVSSSRSQSGRFGSGSYISFAHDDVCLAQASCLRLHGPCPGPWTDVEGSTSRPQLISPAGPLPVLGPSISTDAVPSRGVTSTV